jgi:hypothetical protein
MIIAAFDGVGKTYFCNHVEDAKDFDCMPYKYLLPETDSDSLEGEKAKANFDLEMNPKYPENYIHAILENKDSCEYLVIPSDYRVLAGLAFQNVPYILCFPTNSAKEEYLKRFRQRGNTEDFIDIFIGGWDDFMVALRKDRYGVKVILDKNEYLLDAKERIDKFILSEKAPIQDYRVTGTFNPYLIGAKIIDVFVLSEDVIGCGGDRGMAIIFEKDNERGMLIYGYNDLGEWINFLQVGNKVVCDELIKYYVRPYRLSQLLKKYRIEAAGYCGGTGSILERDL